MTIPELGVGVLFCPLLVLASIEPQKEQEA